MHVEAWGVVAVSVQFLLLRSSSAHNAWVSDDSDSDNTDVQGARCSSMQCPEGYVSKTDAVELRCAKDPCDVQNDKDICCQTQSQAEAPISALPVASGSAQPPVQGQSAPVAAQREQQPRWTLARSQSGCTNQGSIQIGTSIAVNSAGECGARCSSHLDPHSSCIAFAYSSGTHHECHSEGLVAGHCYLWSGRCISGASSCLDQYISLTEQPGGSSLGQNQTGALCTSMNCPVGYRPNADQSRRCSSTPCTEGVDTLICCVSESQATTLAPNASSPLGQGNLHVLGITTTTDMPWGWPWWAWFLLALSLCLLCSLCLAGCLGFGAGTTRRTRKNVGRNPSRILVDESQYEREAVTAVIPARQLLVEEPGPPPALEYYPQRGGSFGQQMPGQSFRSTRSAPHFQAMPIESSFSLQQQKQAQAIVPWSPWVQQAFQVPGFGGFANAPSSDYASGETGQNGTRYASPAWLYT
mmetsp:Transcript_67447/g.161811  ORF Transcript_67447/g.161811 Transcript_67447/m.161811 type:complete len:469 (+) Transcript_67447:79-1485(+)